MDRALKIARFFALFPRAFRGFIVMAFLGVFVLMFIATLVMAPFMGGAESQGVASPPRGPRWASREVAQPAPSRARKASPRKAKVQPTAAPAIAAPAVQTVRPVKSIVLDENGNQVE